MKSKLLKNSLQQISTEKEENFSLLGIISPKPIYKLAYLLNQNLNFDFKLLNDEHLNYAIPNLTTLYTAHYIIDWYLFANTFPKKNKKIKDFDYFLIGFPKLEDNQIQPFLKQVNSINEITISAIIEHRKEIVELFSSIL
ncbi:MAG: hypothetical protein KatS3mg035_0011 [Bacteroidia bacterium]|nr:MAG: hypothetical protein KatS3mg035_0011 [Bacteroidia bacterium]